MRGAACEQGTKRGQAHFREDRGEEVGTANRMSEYGDDHGMSPDNVVGPVEV